MAKGYSSRSMDMTEGPLLGKIIRYSIPVMLTSILQLLYNAADIVVVGRFAGTTALAAVGAAGPLNTLMINLFIGLSVGTSVVVAQHYGAERYKDVQDTIHTAMLLSLICSALCLAIGVLFHRPLLQLMGTPEDVVDMAATYMLILFLGVPFMLVFNFGAAILRAVGDTRRPLIVLSSTGFLNVFLNLFFVIVMHMDAAGVALATVISQAVSTVIIILLLMREEGVLHFDPRKMFLQKDIARNIIRVGLPAGVQGMIFSISNSLMQSTINSFGAITIAGNTAAGNIEAFLYNAQNAFYQAAITFTGQNIGAGKPERVKKIVGACTVCVVTLCVAGGVTILLFGPQLIGIYNTDPEVISWGIIRNRVLMPLYSSCALMDMFTGVLRGMGYSLQPMLLSIFSVCGIRIFWIFVIFPLMPELWLLYCSYPVSWTIAALLEFVFFLFQYKKIMAKRNAELAQ